MTAPEELDPRADPWPAFCRRLETLGTELTNGTYPGSPRALAEGHWHVAQQLACWLGWSVGHADPSAPMFQRQNDLVTQWGGPNYDNTYHHARIDPALRYRITGSMGSCDEFILAVRAGFMHMEQWGTLVEVTASELGLGPGDDFVIELNGDGPGAITLPPEAVMVSIRSYFFDWKEEEPATYRIECLDPRPPTPLTPAAIAGQLDEAMTTTEASVRYWNRYMIDARAERVDNEFAPPLLVAKGLKAAQYVFCFYALEPGQALYVESDVPNARYWSLQQYTLGWFEPFEYRRRTAGVNQAQAHVDADGKVRAVLADRDPGVPNWLDTDGRREALLTFRWFWATGDPPTPTTRVVPIDDVRAAFPSDTPVVTPEERAETIRRQEAHLRWRFRT